MSINVLPRTHVYGRLIQLFRAGFSPARQTYTMKKQRAGALQLSSLAVVKMLLNRWNGMRSQDVYAAETKSRCPKNVG